MPKVSIIVPVYKVEKYIRRCLDSIIAQTFTDWECLLVDDGSPDNSGKICDEYAEKDSRFRVFHKENGGVSSARNEGLYNAVGDYIMFIDADDTLNATSTQYLMQKIDTSHDIVGWGYNKIFENNKVIVFVPKCTFYDNPLSFINSLDYSHMVWAYLFRSSIIKSNRIVFPNGVKYSEDQCFLLEYLRYCKNIKLIRKTLYNYVHREGSAVSVGKSMRNYSYNLSVANILSAKQDSFLSKSSLYMIDYYLQSVWRSVDYDSKEFSNSYKNIATILKSRGVSFNFLSYKWIIFKIPCLHIVSAPLYTKIYRQVQRFVTYKQYVVNKIIQGNLI